MIEKKGVYFHQMVDYTAILRSARFLLWFKCLLNITLVNEVIQLSTLKYIL